MNSGIYMIKNKVNEKIYIGSSVDIDNRLVHHINSLKRGDHHSIHLQRAWNLYGAENFTFETIEEVKRYEIETDEEFKNRLVHVREQHYLDTLFPWKRKIGYNICSIADSPLGIKRSEKTKEKLRIFFTGKTRSEETKQKISEGLKNSENWKKSVTSDEFKEKMRLLNLGEKNPMWNKEGVHGEEHYMWGRFGKLHHRAKIVLQYEKDGTFVKEWESIADAQRAGYGQSNISSCCSGKLKSAYGYVWKYKI